AVRSRDRRTRRGHRESRREEGPEDERDEGARSTAGRAGRTGGDDLHTGPIGRLLLLPEQHHAPGAMFRGLRHATSATFRHTPPRGQAVRRTTRGRTMLGRRRPPHDLTRPTECWPMTRILLRSGKDPFVPIPPENALANFRRGVFGRNVGNFVFTDAVHRILSTPGTEIASNSYLSERPGVTRRYVARINDEFDAFVIPLANAFRPKFLDHLRRLTKVIEQLRIPTIVVGVGVAGGAGSLDNPLPTDSAELAKAVQRFVRAVLERSATVGVRGEITREYLARLGFGDEHVDVVGCPSLFRDGDTLRIEKRAPSIEQDSEFTINISPYVREMQKIAQRHARKYP